jgi:hypothetical protein
MQKKRHSLLEAVISTSIGFAVAFVMNLIVMPLVFDVKPTMTQNTVATVIFTIASLLRGYWVRRLFNYLHAKEIL